MKAYAVLLRGINVGGKNKMPMAGLKKLLEGLGFSDVKTYIASGNAVLRSDKSPSQVKAAIEKALPQAFKLDAELIKVLVLSHGEIRSMIAERPKGFGDEPTKHHSDAIFLIGLKPAEALAVFSPREGVDKVWGGKGLIYSQRLSAKRTQSRLGKIMGTPAYQSMTIRNWRTTTTLLEMLDALMSPKKKTP